MKIPIVKVATLSTWIADPIYVNGVAEADLQIVNVPGLTNFSQIIGGTGYAVDAPWAYFITNVFYSGGDIIRVAFNTTVPTPTSQMGRWILRVFYI